MSDIDVQKLFYNEMWKDFQYVGNFGLARCIAILQALHSLKLNQPSIIDLGTGPGWLASILGQFGSTVGVELSDEAVHAARQKYPHVSYINRDIFALDFPPESFDVSISQEVIEHVEDQERFIDINWQLLKNGGYIILTTPNGRVMRNIEPSVARRWTNQPLENWLSMSEMRKLLTPKFKNVKIKTIIPTTLPQLGFYKLFNNRIVRGGLNKTGTGQYFDTIALQLGFGLHQVVVARKG